MLAVRQLRIKHPSHFANRPKCVLKKKNIVLVYCIENSKMLKYIAENKILGHVGAFWTSQDVVWVLFVKSKKCFKNTASSTPNSVLVLSKGDCV